MANWVRDFLDRHPGAQIAKRARHSLHVRRPDGKIEAHFTGVPCHYQDEYGEWQPLDTTPVHDDVAGRWHCPGLPVTVDDDGTVRVGKYGQLTRRVGLFRPSTMSMLGTRNVPLGTRNVPLGTRDGDALVADGDWWRVERRITEIGYREWLTLKVQPDVNAKAGDYLVLETVVTGVALPNGWVDDKYNIAAHWSPAPVAWDANGVPLECKRYCRNGILYTGIPVEQLAGAAYPVVIDPDFAGATADGYVLGTRHNQVSGSYNTTGSALEVGQYCVSTYGYYSAYRSYLKFDTSAIGTGTVTQVNLELVCTTDRSTNDFDVQIVQQDWADHDPIGALDREPIYDECFSSPLDDAIWRNTNGIATNTTYQSGNLDTAWVVTDGATYYSLRSSRDTNGDIPDTYTNEYITLASANHATEAYRPVLVVLYEEGGGEEYEQGVAGVFTAAAALSRLTSKPLSGAFAPAGALLRGSAKGMAGTLTESGALSRGTAKPFAGTWTASGSVSTARLILRALAGAWTAAGALTRTAGKGLVGALSPAGLLARLTGKAANGAFSPAGSVAKGTAKPLAGEWAGTGTISKRPQRALAGLWTGVGSLARSAGKGLAGTFSPTGAVTRQAGKVLAGVWEGAGELDLLRALGRAVGGVWTATGTLGKGVGKGIAGVFLPQGVVQRALSRSLAGALATAGTLSRAVSKALGGDWSALGELLAVPEALHVFLEGVWAGTGTVARHTYRGLAGTLTLTGRVGKGIAKFFSGVWTAIGALVKVRIPKMVHPLIVDVDASAATVDVDGSAATVEIDASTSTVEV